MLATLKLNPAKTRFISKFIDAYLELNAIELVKLREELKLIAPQEKEVVMEYVTSWEREGIKKGLEQGKKQGTLALIERWIVKKFGGIEPEYQQQLQALSQDQLEQLGDALLDFSQQSDLAEWLQKQR